MKTKKRIQNVLILAAVMALLLTPAACNNTVNFDVPKPVASARQLANEWKADYEAILARTTDTVAIADEAAVDAALAAYSALSDAAKALLGAEKTLLDNLRAKIAELKTTPGPDAFRAVHAAILAKTPDTVVLADEAALTAALAAYTALSDSVKALLAGEKTLLDSLKVKIDALKENATPQELADAFKTGYAAILAKTADTVVLADEAVVDAALAAYSALGDNAKSLLDAEKTLLDNLKEKCTYLSAAAGFRAAHAAILAKTPDTVTLADEIAVNAALAAYAALSDPVKALLGAEKTLLDNLKAKIDALKAAATPQELADAFKTGHAVILAKTPDTVAIADEAAVDTALAAYSALSDAAKALLTVEKARLDSLKAKITVIKTHTSYTLAAYTLKTTALASGTQVNTNELLTWTGETWAGQTPLTVANRENTPLGAAVYLENATAVFVTAPLTGPFTWKMKARLRESSGSGALIAGAFTDPTVYGRIIGTRLQTSGSMRNVWHRGSDGNLGTGSDNAGRSLDQVYLFEISRLPDGSFTGKVTNADGGTALANWSVSAGSASTNFHADLDSGKAVYPGFFVGQADVTVSEMTLVRDIDYTGPTPPEAAQNAATAFLSAHSAILAKTPATVTLADNSAYEAAAAAYTALPYNAKILAAVVTARETLDRLKTKLNELTAVNNFTTAHAAVLAKTIATIAIADEAAVDAALAAYSALSDPVKALLAAEKALLDSLEAKIDELIASAGPQALADAFKTTHAAILAKTTGTVTIADKAAVDAALTAYTPLSDPVKALLTTEKTLLDSLKTRIDEIIAAGKKLVIKSQTTDAGNTADTQAGEWFLLLTNSGANTWTWSGTVQVTNTGGGTLASNGVQKSTMLYLDAPITSSYTFTAQINMVGASTATQKLLFGEIANPSTAMAATFKHFVGVRHYGDGKGRGYYSGSTSDNLGTLGAEFTKAVNTGTVYKYTITWNAIEQKYTVSVSLPDDSSPYNPGDFLISNMGSAFSTHTASYHPGVLVLSNTISISEVTLTVTP
jgi:DNA replication initiation complex subunit (GINS family)